MKYFILSEKIHVFHDKEEIFLIICTRKKPSVRAAYILSVLLCTFQQLFFFFVRRKPAAVIFR